MSAGGGLKILITNLKLSSLSGTELYVRDVALALQRRGHRPSVYAPIVDGPVADALAKATVPLTTRLDGIGFEPDVIHGQHAHQTMAAIARFARTPALFFCHSYYSWHDEPPLHPRVHRYVAVDRACYDRMVVSGGVPAERARLVLNFVDLERFRPRASLPDRPRRAVWFSNRARPGPALDAVTEGCRRAGVVLDVIGHGIGRATARPEDALGAYDVVLAKAKAAMEGIAVGAAVILCDTTGFGGLVTSERFDRLRENNFGARVAHEDVTADGVAAALAAYDPADAARVSARFRSEGGLEATVDVLLGLYEEVIDEQREAGPPDAEAERRAVAGYLERIASTGAIVDSANYKNQNKRLSGEVDRLRAEIAGLRTKPRWLRFLR